jgi:hypothetical protein
MDSRTPRVIQQTRVIVGDHREQARSYKGLTDQHYAFIERRFSFARDKTSSQLNI